MTTHTTKEQALEVLRDLTAVHANEDYFKKAEIVHHDIGFGVDILVDGVKWRNRPNPSPIPPVITRVPICILMVG
jgi:hypothetical protein